MGIKPARPLADVAFDRSFIDHELGTLIDGSDQTPVRDAMRHAVFGGGQRLRPLLSLRIARWLGTPVRKVATAAAAVELIHCASLIIDDLPCMDDETTRRGVPCTHVKFGESTAILAAFALVSIAARAAAANSRFQKKLLGVLDCNSLIGGQSLDLTDLKTVPLFELAIQAGGCGNPAFPEHEHTLMRFAREFGLAFQLTDDWLDGDLADPAPALQQIESARTVARALDNRATDLLELTDYLHERIWETNRSHR